MKEPQNCFGCGAEIPPNTPSGHCPKCLLGLGFDPAAAASDAAARPAAFSGHTFGDYELQQQIDRGGMGVVYQARQISLNRRAALKLISAGEFASPALIQRFHIEAEAAAGLRHPNIVAIYETGEFDGHHYFSMELIEGTGLEKYIQKGREARRDDAGSGRILTRERQLEIARIVAKVAHAVDYAHRHGVLHRDLKPSNIILDVQDEPHLTDFGVAKVVGQPGSMLTASDAILGTPAYMAPEQASGQTKRVTTTADIYSLGAILYQMLTGRPPFRAETPLETLRKVVEEEPRHPTTLVEMVNNDLATICMKCLEKEPARRYPSAAALAEDLERWLRKEPIQARPVNTAERVWRWCRGNPKVAVLGGTVMLLTFALIVVLVSLVKNERDRLELAEALGKREKEGRELAEAERKRAEEAKQKLSREVLDRLVQLYSVSNTTFYTIKAEVRHALVSPSHVTNMAGKPLELTLVDYVYLHPTNILDIFAPILETLEWDLTCQLQRPVLIHLRMLRSYDLGYGDLETGTNTFGRVGPASLCQLLDKDTGVESVAMRDQKRPLTLALFTRANIAVARAMQHQSNLSLAGLLANRSIALGNSRSTTGNYVPRWFLADNGVFATNLSRYQNLQTPVDVTDAIRSDRFDVGAVNWETLRKEADLLVVAKFEVADVGRCWVAGRGLDSMIFTAIRRSLLQMTNPAVIGKIESELDGFKVVDKQALVRVRDIMREADVFEPPKTQGSK